MLSRFVNGRRSLDLTTADKVAIYLGLALVSVVGGRGIRDEAPKNAHLHHRQRRAPG